MIDKLTMLDVTRTSDVDRWHMVRIGRKQTLADHLARVALFAGVLLGRAGGLGFGDGDKLALIEHALLHDMEEVMFGDIATPAKELLGLKGSDVPSRIFWASHDKAEPPTYRKEVNDIVWLADKMDALLYFLYYGATQFVNGVNVSEGLTIALYQGAKARSTKDTDWVKIVDALIREVGFEVNFKEENENGV